ncbi:hypothetical protein CJF32_00010700 [Rutstroemia sp. NJR-2017a WRK4]|nr:hypothetical protein CJF32_00010700 [Rutstroemia sp. NJR-2017a WRK4]
MSLIRLLQYKPNREIVFREPTSGEVPAYAILSHTLGEEEVVYRDLKKGKDKSRTVNKAGWRKIQFCTKQAVVDGLDYFWIDTCYIDKKNTVELGTVINFMFRTLYVAISTFRMFPYPILGWITRGYRRKPSGRVTLQELITPRLVNFFSSEGKRFGSKLSLESEINEITGIEIKAFQGNTLSSFSIKERRYWTEHCNTTIEEDEAYSTKLISIGVDFEQFAIGLNLASFPEATQFVAREKKLSKIYKLLQDHNSRSCVILYSLGAIFWLNTNNEDLLKLSFRDIVQQVLRYYPSTTELSSIDQDKDLD